MKEVHRNGDLGKNGRKGVKGNGWDVRAVGHEREWTNRGWTAGSAGTWMETGAVVLLLVFAVPLFFWALICGQHTSAFCAT